MKKILALFILLAIFKTTIAQTNDTAKYNPKTYGYGWVYNRIKLDSGIIIPRIGDTTSKTKGQLRILGNSLCWVGNDGKWYVAGSGSSTPGIDAVLAADPNLTTDRSILAGTNEFSVTGNTTLYGTAKLSVNKADGNGIFLKTLPTGTDPSDSIFIKLDNQNRALYLHNQSLGDDISNTIAISQSNISMQAYDAATGMIGTEFVFSPTGSFFLDSRVAPAGIEYGADYSSTYTDRSLVDKAYVLAHAGGTNFANTDLTFTGDRFHSGAGYAFNFNGFSDFLLQGTGNIDMTIDDIGHGAEFHMNNGNSYWNTQINGALNSGSSITQDNTNKIISIIQQYDTLSTTIFNKFEISKWGFDFQSEDRPLIIPRLTLAQRDAITALSTGGMVWLSDSSYFSVYNGSEWVMLGGSGGSFVPYTGATGNVDLGTNSYLGASYSAYNTSDHTTNYERGRLYYNSNVLTLASEAGGTGTVRNMRIDAGTGTLTFNAPASYNFLNSGALTTFSGTAQALAYLSNATTGNGLQFLNTGAEITNVVNFSSRAAGTTTNGSNLLLAAQGASSGGTDLDGGDIQIKSGTSTGTAQSKIQFSTPDISGSGTTDNTPVLRAEFNKDGLYVKTITDGAAGTDSLLVESAGQIKKIAASSYGTGLTVLADATNADFTMSVNAIKYLPAATLSTNRTITIPAGTNGDLMEIYNNEAGFNWNLAGSAIYLSDGVTTVTTLLANTNYIIRFISSKWRISN